MGNGRFNATAWTVSLGPGGTQRPAWNRDVRAEAVAIVRTGSQELEQIVAGALHLPKPSKGDYNNARVGVGSDTENGGR